MHFLSTSLLASVCGESAGSQEGSPLGLVFACSEGNDLFRLVSEKDVSVTRCDSVAEAIENAPTGGGVLLLADEYPDATTEISATLFELAAKKDLQLYLEYPSWLPDVEVGAPDTVEWERAVISSDVFGSDLERLRILAIHGCRFVPAEANQAHVVMARVAGFDTAVYGLPEVTHPILFEHPRGNVLVATTKLSHFVTARYAPEDAWRAIWSWILMWTSRGKGKVSLEWTPSACPSFGRIEDLPENVEAQALRRGAQWFFKAGLFPESPSPEDRHGRPPEQAGAEDFGRSGMAEGFSAKIHPDGSQDMARTLRNDCMGEATGALAFDAVINEDDRSRGTALNLADFIYFDSDITKGPRGLHTSSSFGLMSWDLSEGSLGVYYGDDNARSMLGTLACAALLGVDRWDEKILRCMMANLRTTGTLGFRGRRLDEDPLQEKGWQHYYGQPITHYAPHYEAYLWACFLWAYRQTGYEPFLTQPKNALRMTMDAYPDEWQWTNGLQQERARILLPLAWLVRAEDTPEHRTWLRRIAGDLIASQDGCGAIREELGAAAKGSYAPPKSNAEYGTREAPLIQENSDALSDMLYTTNFAFLGLHEAAAATGESLYRDAEDRLAKFLCRIQIRSEAHSELDGGWFRAFDFERWEYWASNGDLGWGAWSIESGWTCGWISSVFGLRYMNSSLWELTAGSAIGQDLSMLQEQMLRGAPGKT
jgi:hypothetical protein